MSRKKFIQWLNCSLNKVIQTSELHESLKIIVVEYTKYFPKSKIWIAEKLGKRISYITGAGSESYLEAEEIATSNGYLIFIENMELDKWERNALSSLIEVITKIKEDDTDES